MMDHWRKKGDKYNQEFGRSKSNYYKRKPPAGGNSNGQHNISSWEKRFVTSSISWKQFLEAKRYTYLYNNVLNWDDSAGEEAFKTAKDAFYAKLHGIPYDIKSHDPDFYNNKIDWNSQENNDLIRDFESEPVVQDIDSDHEPVVIFGDALPNPYKNYAPYGWGDAEDKVKGSWGVGDDMNKGEGNNGIIWDNYIEDGKILWDNTDTGCPQNNDWWDWNDNKAVDQGWNETDNKAVDQGWNCNDNKTGYQGWNETDTKVRDQGWNYNDNKTGYQGWNETDNKVIDQGWNCYDNKAGDQGWNETDNKAGYQGWNEADNKASDQGWNSYGDKAGEQGWHNYVYDYNNYYPSHGNNNNNYHPSYGNVNNKRYETCNFTGNNSQRSRTWKNNGNRSRSSGQGYGRQRAHGSTMHAHGGQRIHVNQ